MIGNAAENRVGPASLVYHYQRHRSEQTLLYQIIEQYYPAFAAHLAEQGIELPEYVQRKFVEYLESGRLAHGFMSVTHHFK